MTWKLRKTQEWTLNRDISVPQTRVPEAFSESQIAPKNVFKRASRHAARSYRICLEVLKLGGQNTPK